MFSKTTWEKISPSGFLIYLKQKKQQNKAGNKNNGYVDTYPICYHDSKGITAPNLGKNNLKNAMSETLSDKELKKEKS